MLKHKLLLISRAGDETNNLRKELKRQSEFLVDVASSPAHAIHHLTTQRVDLVVFNMDTFTQKKLQIATDLRELGYDFPLLILAHTILPEAFSSIENMSGTVLLEKPYDIKDLYGLSDKLIAGRDVKQRIFRRYYTNQLAEFSPLKTGSTVPTRIRNLSRGGAFLEYDGRTALLEGDRLMVEIPLTEMSKTYKMTAVVVWVSPSTMVGRTGLGVEFLK